MKYRTSTQQSKYSNLPTIEVEIISIDEVKIYQTGKTKWTFTAQEVGTEKTRQCVAWKNNSNSLNCGDILQIKGWRKEDLFLIASFLRVKRAEFCTSENSVSECGVDGNEVKSTTATSEKNSKRAENEC